MGSFSSAALRTTLVLGGARSGKSRYAEALVERQSAARVYLATAEAGDVEMEARIRRHRARRGPGWRTVEAPLELARAIEAEARRERAVLVDCLTLWLANLMGAARDVERETEILVACLGRVAGPVVLVSNEVGYGIVPDNEAARMSADGKLPATVITGFLGAGKTTLIRHLLRHANGKRLALIVNEFGEVGIDGEILKGCGDAACAEDDIVELANGCICCTVADAFLPTMEKLLARRESLDHIVIETSGLALPKPLVQAFNWPAIRTRVTVDGVVAVIDGAAVAAGRFASNPALVAAQRAADPSLDHLTPLEELFEDQLAAANLVVVNKADLLDAASLARVEDEIGRTLGPAAKSIQARFGAVDPRVLLGLGLGAEETIETRRTHHDGETEHDHDEFASFAVEIAELASPAELLSRLEPAIARHDILRVKGFAAVAGKPMRLVIQGVGARLQHYYDRDWRASEARRGRLVVIGERGLDEAAIRAALGG